MAAKPDVNTRVSLLETGLRELRRDLELAAKYGAKVSSEVLYRMWQAEREDNIRLRVLMQEREREHEAFKERVESGLQLLYDRAADVSARLAGIPKPEPDTLTAAEQRTLHAFRRELKAGTDGQKLY